VGTEEKRILFVVGDIGSANALIPVIKRLRQEGHNILVLADQNGKGKETLVKAEVSFVLAQMDSLSTQRPPALVVCGTSATANGAQINLTQKAKEAGVPTIWLQDFWGTESVPSLKGLRPDVLLTLDAGGARYKGTKVIPTGNPAFDRLVSWDVAKIRQRVREAMGVTEDAKLVTYFGPGYEADLPARVFESLALLVPDLVRAQAIFVPMLHPKDETLTPGLKAMFSAWYTNPAKAPFPTYRDARVDPTALVCASDVVTSPSSTELLSACLLGVPAVALMGPQSRQYLLSRGLKALPCCQNGAVGLISFVSSNASICSLLDGPVRQGFIARQREHYKNDGGATDRVVAEIKRLLGE